MSSRERYLRIEGKRIFIVTENDGWRFIHRGAEESVIEAPDVEWLRVHESRFYDQALKHFSRSINATGGGEIPSGEDPRPNKVCPVISPDNKQGEKT